MEDLVVFLIVAHQVAGNAHEAVFVLHALLAQHVAADGGQRQESGPARVTLLEVPDGGLGILLPVHHDVLHGGAQSDLHGHGVALVGGHEAGHRGVDAPQSLALRGLHHRLDGL